MNLFSRLTDIGSEKGSKMSGLEAYAFEKQDDPNATQFDDKELAKVRSFSHFMLLVYDKPTGQNM